MTPETTEAVRKALNNCIQTWEALGGTAHLWLEEAKAALALLDAESEGPVGTKSAEELLKALEDVPLNLPCNNEDFAAYRARKIAIIKDAIASRPAMSEPPKNRTEYVLHKGAEKAVFDWFANNDLPPPVESEIHDLLKSIEAARFELVSDPYKLPPEEATYSDAAYNVVNLAEIIMSELDDALDGSISRKNTLKWLINLIQEYIQKKV